MNTKSTTINGSTHDSRHVEACASSGQSPPLDTLARHVQWDTSARWTAARMRPWHVDLQAAGLGIVATLKGPDAAKAVASCL